MSRRYSVLSVKDVARWQEGLKRPGFHCGSAGLQDPRGAGTGGSREAL